MKISFLKITLILFALVFFLSSFVVSAGTEHNMSGWAYSSNIGWISFNCTNDNSCATHNYGVNQDANGNLVGYAFSSSIGWIQFGNLLSGFPKQGSPEHDALVVSGKLSGWAKAIGADGNDWDGWISLSDTTTPKYGVTIDQTTGKFSGYAWGSDVMGIVNFDGVTVLATPTGLIPKASGCGTKEIKVTWTPSVGATSYTLKVDGTPVNTGLATSYTHAIPVVPSSHDYAVQATYSSGSSLFSPSISENAPVACSVRGECSSPANHLNPCSTGTPGSTMLSSPSKWTWTCTEDLVSLKTCSENKSPGYIEN